ncbi:uncharacterized protein METZ01_LOCUS206768, partial [marine metagenome]
MYSSPGINSRAFFWPNRIAYHFGYD